MKAVMSLVALILAILFWLVGFAVLICGFILTGVLQSAGRKLMEHAEHEKGKDNSASLAMAIEGRLLRSIPGYVVHLGTVTAGLTLIAIGCVAIAFYCT